MPSDDLHTPLGLDPDPQPGPGRDIPWNLVGFAGLALLAGGLFAFARLTDDGMGGEPYAIARIEPAKIAPPPPPVTPVAPPPAGAAPSAEDTTATVRVISGLPPNAAEIERASGVKVIRPGDAPPPEGLIIQTRRGAAAVDLAAAPDRRLVERGKYGPLPRIGADGARPSDVYARPVVASLGLPPNAPRIALVVGGMGISLAATRLATEKLPVEATFAFAASAQDLEKQAARARADGHETLLQLPLEDVAGVDLPASRALQSGLSPEQFLDRLSWHLSRFTGYIGVENFMGQRFLSDEAATGALSRELARRGLLFLDDGSVATSLGPMLAATAGAPTARADVLIDADRNPAAIEAALARLERIAREKGSAIGVMSALPATVERVATFAEGLRRRGVALAPLSALVTKTSIPSARL